MARGEDNEHRGDFPIELEGKLYMLSSTRRGQWPAITRIDFHVIRAVDSMTPHHRTAQFDFAIPPSGAWRWRESRVSNGCCGLEVRISNDGGGILAGKVELAREGGRKFLKLPLRSTRRDRAWGLTPRAKQASRERIG